MIAELGAACTTSSSLQHQMVRNILLVYASHTEDGGLEQAIALAIEHRARLTIVVPVPEVMCFAACACVDVEAARADLLAEAESVAARAVARVPDDVSVTAWCATRRAERALARSVEAAAYDLCITSDARTDPGRLWGSMGARLIKRARRHGVATLIVPRCGAIADSPVPADRPPVNGRSQPA